MTPPYEELVTSLFLDIQEVTLFLGEFGLFAHENLYYPLPGYSGIFNNIHSTLACDTYDGMQEKL